MLDIGLATSLGSILMGVQQIDPSALSAVIITDQLARRGTSNPHYIQQKLGVQDLAEQAGAPGHVLPHLVQLALEICKSDSAGVSVYESGGSIFRWHHVTGTLEKFDGATTPRDFSPCGVCLDQHRPVLMERPEQAYPWIKEAGITVPEVLLVPIFVGNEPFGTLWIVAHDQQQFDAGDARVMAELAAFAGLALRMTQAEASLKPTRN